MHLFRCNKNSFTIQMLTNYHCLSLILRLFSCHSLSLGFKVSLVLVFAFLIFMIAFFDETVSFCQLPFNGAVIACKMFSLPILVNVKKGTSVSKTKKQNVTADVAAKDSNNAEVTF